jgi:flagellar protein FliO/FliZ
VNPSWPLDADGFTSLTLTIGAIVLILWGALWIVRRSRPGAALGGGRDCVVLRSLPLGPRERLLVVRVGSRHLVLGVGSAAVSLLCELDGPLQSADPADRPFGDTVRKAMERWRAGS